MTALLPPYDDMVDVKPQVSILRYVGRFILISDAQ
jgi:hypothetical protein